MVFIRAPLIHNKRGLNTRRVLHLSTTIIPSHHLISTISNRTAATRKDLLDKIISLLITITRGKIIRIPSSSSPQKVVILTGPMKVVAITGNITTTLVLHTRAHPDMVLEFPPQATSKSISENITSPMLTWPSVSTPPPSIPRIPHHLSRWTNNIALNGPMIISSKTGMLPVRISIRTSQLMALFLPSRTRSSKSMKISFTRNLIEKLRPKLQQFKKRLKIFLKKEITLLRRCKSAQKKHSQVANQWLKCLDPWWQA
jgi:hypothetical protein